MSRVIYKYDISSGGGRFFIDLPSEAHILSVETQHNGVKIWALVNPEVETETRELFLIGTGHIIADELVERLEYIGTFKTDPKGTFIFHLFEVHETPQ